MRGRDETEMAMDGISKENQGRAFASPWEGEQWRIKDRPIGSDTLNGGGGYSYMCTRLALIVVKKYDIIYGGCNAVDSLQMLWSSIKPERGLIGAV